MSGAYSNLNQRLANLTTETTANAIILLRRKQLIASSGILPTSAIQELVEVINSYGRLSAQNLNKQVVSGLPKPVNGDLVRFIQLQATRSKHLLYVISLTREFQLGLIFDQGTRFSEVRRQTKHVANALLAPERTNTLEYRSAIASVENIQGLPSMDPIKKETSPSAANLQPSVPMTDQPSQAESPATEDLLPTGTKIHDSNEQPTEEKTSAAPDLNEYVTAGYHDSAELDDLGPPGTTNDQSSRKNSMQITGSHYITYSCMLIPRMPQHLLTSNLASHLFTWMGQLCLAYGWRLEHLSIHSGHIQWIAGAPLTISPAYLVRIVRQQTSQYIFTQFPPLTNDNPSGDFWAPGFYISGGKQFFQPHLTEKIVNEVREQQGVYNSTLYH